MNNQLEPRDVWAIAFSKMKRVNFLILIGLILVPFSVCAQRFTSPDAKLLASRQQTIAIVPATVTIAENSRVTAEARREQQQIEALNFQKEIYNWMMKRKMQGKISKEIQDVETTNALLQRAGYPETPLTTAELCETLGVDGIVLSTFGLSKPVSEGAAVAALLITGSRVNTNQVRTTLSAYDRENKKLIWIFERKLSGGVGSTPTSIVDQVMRQASRKMPYFKN